MIFQIIINFLFEFKKNQKLTLSLQSLQSSSKDTRDQLTEEVRGIGFFSANSKLNVSSLKLRHRQEDLFKLKDELRSTQINHDNDLRQKELIIEGLHQDLAQKKNKVIKFNSCKSTFQNNLYLQKRSVKINWKKLKNKTAKSSNTKRNVMI